MLVELRLKLMVLLLLENPSQFVHLTIFPPDGVFELFDPIFEIDWSFKSPALLPREGDGVHFTWNGFAAFTDREFVLSVKLAVLDFTEAEVLGVGVGWVHIAMMFVGLSCSSVGFAHFPRGLYSPFALR